MQCGLQQRFQCIYYYVAGSTRIGIKVNIENLGNSLGLRLKAWKCFLIAIAIEIGGVIVAAAAIGIVLLLSLVLNTTLYGAFRPRVCSWSKRSMCSSSKLSAHGLNTCAFSKIVARRLEINLLQIPFTDCARHHVLLLLLLLLLLHLGL